MLPNLGVAEWPNINRLHSRLAVARSFSVILIWPVFLQKWISGGKLSFFQLRPLNHRHALTAGLCTIVPTSSEEPKTVGPEDCLIPAGKYWSFTVDSWVRAKNLVTVPHDRLSLLHKNNRPHPTEFLDEADMARVAAAIKYVLDLA